MKISVLVLGIIIIVMALLSIGYYGQSLNDQISANQLNISFTNKSGVYEDINSSTGKLKQSLIDISNKREQGFLSVLAEGLYALPLALIQVPLLIFTVVTSAATDLSTMLLGFALPSAIIGAMILFVFTWAVFELIKVFAGKDI